VYIFKHEVAPNHTISVYAYFTLSMHIKLMTIKDKMLLFIFYNVT